MIPPAAIDRLRAFVRRRVRNEADVDDVLQETLARASAGTPRRLEPWLFAIARNAVADHYRRRAPASLDRDVAVEAEPSTVTAELASCLPPMMEALPEEDREALRSGDAKELAVRLGLSLSGAKSRVQRARKRLRETLLDCCDVELDRRGNAVDFAPAARNSCVHSGDRPSCGVERRPV
jgi:RNA polymerase sigma-70 factor (ECF subfamily)